MAVHMTITNSYINEFLPIVNHKAIMPHNDSPPKIKNDLPSPEQTRQIEDAVRNLLNPNGENPNMDQYVTNTFDYITNMFDKMQNASDPDAASKEIAEDLRQKFDNWAEKYKQAEVPEAEKSENEEKH